MMKINEKRFRKAVNLESVLFPIIPLGAGLAIGGYINNITSLTYIGSALASLSLSSFLYFNKIDRQEINKLKQ